MDSIDFINYNFNTFMKKLNIFKNFVKLGGGMYSKDKDYKDIVFKCLDIETHIQSFCNRYNFDFRYYKTMQENLDNNLPKSDKYTQIKMNSNSTKDKNNIKIINSGDAPIPKNDFNFIKNKDIDYQHNRDIYELMIQKQLESLTPKEREEVYDIYNEKVYDHAFKVAQYNNSDDVEVDNVPMEDKDKYLEEALEIILRHRVLDENRGWENCRVLEKFDIDIKTMYIGKREYLDTFKIDFINKYKYPRELQMKFITLFNKIGNAFLKDNLSIKQKKDFNRQVRQDIEFLFNQYEELLKIQNVKSNAKQKYIDNDEAKKKRNEEINKQLKDSINMELLDDNYAEKNDVKFLTIGNLPFC